MVTAFDTCSATTISSNLYPRAETPPVLLEVSISKSTKCVRIQRLECQMACSRKPSELRFHRCGSRFWICMGKAKAKRTRRPPSRRRLLGASGDRHRRRALHGIRVGIAMAATLFSPPFWRQRALPRILICWAAFFAAIRRRQRLTFWFFLGCVAILSFACLRDLLSWLLLPF